MVACQRIYTLRETFGYLSSALNDNDNHRPLVAMTGL